MSVTVTDVTAGLLVLTINNSGQMYFGDGTPINMLTLDGYGIIDNNGHIIHGVGSPALAFTSGSGTLGYVGSGVSNSATITTQAGKQPTLQVDSSYPGHNVYNFTIESEDYVQTNNNCRVQVTGLTTGSFGLTCLDLIQGKGLAGGNTMPGGNPNYSYRWL
jgi:hypothetical protein